MVEVLGCCHVFGVQMSSGLQGEYAGLTGDSVHAIVVYVEAPQKT